MASNTPHGVLVVDFGAQYAQLIARRVREANVYSEIVPSSISSAEVAAKNPEAIILSGGPSSVYAENAPKVDPAIFALGIPTFGICYGFQTMAAALAGVVAQTGKSEFGRTPLEVKPGSKIFAGLPVSQSVWMLMVMLSLKFHAGSQSQLQLQILLSQHLKMHQERLLEFNSIPKFSTQSMAKQF